MTITTRDQLINALGNNSSRIVIDKTSTSGVTSGAYASLWRSTGQPGQGATPTTAAVCDNTFAGSIQFNQQTAPATSYGAWMSASCSNSTATIEIHDRLMHMGGLSGTVTTAQTVGIDLSSNLETSNLSARKGDANYSDVQWWLEWYANTGSTSVNVTINVTYIDGSTGDLTNLSLLASRPALLFQPINSLIPAASSGLYIRGVNTVTLSATTGLAGNFGVTATRSRMTMPLNIGNKSEVFDWATLGLPELYNASCLFPVVLTSTTTTGNVRCCGKIAHG